MRSVLLCASLLFAAALGEASEALTDVSPNKRFAVISGDSSINLVALPNDRVVVANLIDQENGARYSVLWSKDSARLAVYQNLGRFSDCRAFRRRGDSFVELKLPERTLPFAATIQSRVSKWVGQRDTPAKWLDDGSLVVNVKGLVNLSDNASIDYEYDFTIRFDKHGKGEITRTKTRQYSVSVIHRDY
jgi:hypothetical protein